MVEPGIEVVNMMGKWSEMCGGAGKTSVTEMVMPCDRRRSSVCPFSWVAPVVARVRLNEAIRCRNSLPRGLESQHTCTFISPPIKTLSYLTIILDKKSPKSFIKCLYIIIIHQLQRHTRLIKNSWTVSK